MTKSNIEQAIRGASSHLRQNAGRVLGLASSCAWEAGTVFVANHVSPCPRSRRPRRRPRRLRRLRRLRPISQLSPRFGELRMEGVPKWRTLCPGNEPSSVVFRNTGLQVPLNPTKSDHLVIRTANSNSSSVHKPAYCWQRTGQSYWSPAHLWQDNSSQADHRLGSFTFLSLYAPQVDLPESEKERFYDQLQYAVVKVPASEILIPVGDWNSHAGTPASVFSNAHDGLGFGTRNTAG